MQSGNVALQAIEQEFIVRPPTMADVKTVVSFFNLCSLELEGKETWEEAELKMEWQEPGFVLERDCLMVFTQDEQLVGFAEVWDTAEPRVRGHTWVQVHPEYRESELPQYLLAFGHRRAAQMVPAAPEGARVVLRTGFDVRSEWVAKLFEAHGYRPIRYFQWMVVELTDVPEPATMPDGVVIRQMQPEEWKTAVFVQDKSFEDHWGYVKRSDEEHLKWWQHYMEHEPDYDPTLWFVAVADEEIVGVSFCKGRITEDDDMGWVEDLGVLREWRRRGIAEALLRHSIFQLHQRGKKRVGLGVDASSLTGATRLYDKVGMRPTKRSIVFELVLRAGEDLSTQTLAK